MSANYIPIEQAVEMRNEYLSANAPLLKAKSTNNKHVATDFAWIKLEELRAFISRIDTIQELNRIEVTGVRIYFSAYPNTSVFQSTQGPNPYPLRESVFLVPTMKVDSTPLSLQYENLENLPFCIEPSDPTNPLQGDLVIINSLLNFADNTPAINHPPSVNATSTILDNMNMCPPPATNT